ncbi:HD-domain/PDEase-like protein [Rozella allomycis CSF55]|uniref:Phosphodiesterase n=1 Tax=Rozella allomycis (strain CSF55) TaxID=988480 RepID=A0A075AT12_ROZAC|nr:3'5'-cyclic nucleotide phosphodiesterase domain-containing protein [Rozella allomycis CSF55]RKP20818.1 HD-domain/PDEase-like protein [Rozella allomycis CSF55]|eukprot:EPZ33403.1 3'5'-cyclic nucleotide phosphodiesterase domain-containing protein [Rozella allomycis CSF55]
MSLQAQTGAQGLQQLRRKSAPANSILLPTIREPPLPIPLVSKIPINNTEHAIPLKNGLSTKSLNFNDFERNKYTLAFLDPTREEKFRKFFVGRFLSSWRNFSYILAVIFALFYIIAILGSQIQSKAWVNTIALTESYIRSNPNFCPTGWFCSPCKDDKTCSVYSSTPDALLVSLGIELPIIIGILASRRPKIMENYMQHIGVFIILCVTISQTVIRPRIVDYSRLSNSFEALNFTLILFALHLLYRIRFIYTLASSTILLVAFIIQLSFREVSNMTLTSAFAVCAWIITNFLVWESEKFARSIFLQADHLDEKNKNLKDQLHVIKNSYMNVDGADFSNPLQKAQSILSQLLNQPSLDRFVFQCICDVQGLLKSPDLLAPDLAAQVKDNQVKLDLNTQQWLFTELASKKKNNDVSPKGSSQGLTTLVRGSQIGSKYLGGDSALNTVLKEVLKLQEEEIVQCRNALENVLKWDFTALDFNFISKESPLLVLGFHFFTQNGLIQNFHIDPLKFINFLSNIQANYHKSNPYHNHMHAADVLQAVQYYMADEFFIDLLNPLDQLIIYIAAAIHDYDHPGVNNNFLINSSDPKALLYNDKSVLENHHVSASFLIMEKAGNNFLAGLSKADFKQFRQWVIECVLATDLSLHFQFVSTFKAKIAQKEDFQPQNKMDDKLVLCKVLVKCGDVNHPTRPLKTHLRWSKMCIDEFFNQGDQEKKLGLPISPFMDRDTAKVAAAQVGFIDFICWPIFDAFNNYLPMPEVMENLKMNKDYWKSKKEEEDVGIPYKFPEIMK